MSVADRTSREFILSGALEQFVETYGQTEVSRLGDTTGRISRPRKRLQHKPETWVPIEIRGW